MFNADPAKVVGGAFKLALGLGEGAIGGFTMAETDGIEGSDMAGEGAVNIGDGVGELGELVGTRDNRAWKTQAPADWNITVNYLAGQITGGGMDPYDLTTSPLRTVP